MRKIYIVSNFLKALLSNWKKNTTQLLERYEYLKNIFFVK